jgi:hypothetical protein
MSWSLFWNIVNILLGLINFAFYFFGGRKFHSLLAGVFCSMVGWGLLIKTLVENGYLM